MAKFMSLIKNKWFIHLVISLLLIAIILFFGSGFAFRDTYFLANAIVKGILIFIIAAIWALCHLKINLNISRKQNDNKAVVSTEDDKENNQPTTPISLPMQLKQLHQFQKTHHMLKKPIYIYLGSQNIGKTRILQQAGWHFIESIEINFSNRVTWHFYQEAIIVEYDMPKEYIACYEMIKHLKSSKQRIQGLVICLNVESIINQEKSYIQKSQVVAHFVRQIEYQLGIAIPVNILMTQCDKMMGYQSFFASLPDKEQIDFASLFIPSSSADTLLKDMSINFDEMLKNIQQQRICSLQKDRPVQQQQLLYHYYSDVMRLKNGFMEWLTSYKRYASITSLTWLKNIFVISTSNNVSEQIRDNLCHNLWEKILQDKPVSRLSMRKYKQKQVFLVATSVVSSLALITLSIVWSTAYRSQHQQLETISQLAQSYRETQNLWQLRQLNMLAMEQQRNKFREGGLEISSSLKNNIQEKYYSVLDSEFSPVLNRWFTQLLRQLEGVDLYRGVQAYLMFAGQIEKDDAVLYSWVQEVLSQNLVGENDGQYLSYVNDYLGSHNELAINNALLSYAQTRLKDLTIADHTYLRLLAELQQQHRPNEMIISQTTLIVPHIFETAPEELSINPFYTGSGLNRRYVSMSNAVINETINDFNVLSADQVVPDRTQLSQAMFNMYLDDYVQAWQQRLYPISLIRFNSLQQAANVVGWVAQDNSPFDEMLNVLRDNTNPDIVLNTRGSALNSVQKEQARIQLNNAFSIINQFIAPDGSSGVSPAYAELKVSLLSLSQWLQALSSDLNSREASLAIAKSHFNNTADDPLTQLRQQANILPQPLQLWVKQLVQSSWHAILANATLGIEDLWQQQVLPTYVAAIEGRYPFSNYADYAVSINDFEAFFAPNGVLDNFFQDHLAVFTNTQTANWQWRAYDGETILLNNNFLAQLQQANNIRNAFFPAGNTQAAVNFIVRATNLNANADELNLSVYGDVLTYRHGFSGQVQLVWPNNIRRIDLSIVDSDGNTYQRNYSDDWAWLQWVRDNQLDSSPGANTFTLTMQVNDLDSQFELQTTSIYNPLNLNGLENFRLTIGDDLA